jgi:hypothetical protein
MTVKRTNATNHGLFRCACALAIGALCLASTSLTAQVAASTTAEGATISHIAPKASTVVPNANPKAEEALPAGAAVIFSNLGTGDCVYQAGSGWTEAGEKANDYPLAEAMSFTPQNNYLLVRIDTAVTYLEGTNGMKWILAADNAGVPGKSISVFTFSNMPSFGTCCTLKTMKLTASNKRIILTAGQTYWLYPLPADTTSYLIWNLDTTNQGGNGAVSKDYGVTWTPAPLSLFGAFDVYGIQLP